MCGIAGFQFLIDLTKPISKEHISNIKQSLSDKISPVLVSKIIPRGSDAIGALILINSEGETLCFKDCKRDLIQHKNTEAFDILFKRDLDLFVKDLSEDVSDAVDYIFALDSKVFKSATITLLLNSRGIPVTEISMAGAEQPMHLDKKEIQPFYMQDDDGMYDSGVYAVAHNGIFHNDKELSSIYPLEKNLLEQCLDIDSYAPIKLLASHAIENRSNLMQYLEGSAAMSVYDSGVVTLYKDYLSLYAYCTFLQSDTLLSCGVIWCSEPVKTEDVIFTGGKDFGAPADYNIYLEDAPFDSYSRFDVTGYLHYTQAFNKNFVANAADVNVLSNANLLYSMRVTCSRMCSNFVHHSSTVNNKAVVICSGGLDSAVALGEVLARMSNPSRADAICDVTLLYFKYGALAEQKELKALASLYNYYNCNSKYSHVTFRTKIMDMTWLKEIGNSTLTSEDEKLVTNGEHALEKATEWVPARNLAMISATASLCDAEGIGYIVLGLNREESGAFNDNSTEFCDALNKALALGTKQRPKILCPLGNYMKSDIVRRGERLNVPMHLTWSCYRGGNSRCGCCGPCLSVKAAFKMANCKFPFEY